MAYAQRLFPDNIVPFRPAGAGARQGRRDSAAHLDGRGLAQRLRRDVERQLLHRRRMLRHLEAQSRQ